VGDAPAGGSVHAVNRLAGETSPYLRQHADNPVDWYPWGDEAFDRARAEDKPIFLSVGYASCHWCHVMAHESFEDEATAADLAASFVAVKVDREERPDVDALYMTATQALTGSGGWPMSVFCTPDGRPFYAGTYYPPTDRHGLPSFRQVLAAMAAAWATRRDEVERQADALVAAIEREGQVVDELASDGSVPPFDTALDHLAAVLSSRFDEAWGGFGPAPKFPRPTLVELCLRHHRRTGSGRSLEMATTTLDAMAAGGLYDHLVGGFARYSTDTRWLVPHFEKMLTDQALLARAYLHAWQVTGRDDYLAVVTETLDWVLEDLSSPAGGLYSSVDADAAGVEGGHAVFTADEVRSVLAAAGRPELAPVVADWYGVTAAGNWESTNVLHRPVGAPLGRPPDVEDGRRLLAEARRARPQPAVDDKCLTEWNAMAAAVLAEAAAVTGNERWARRAEAVAEFLFAELRRPDGRWLRSWQDGRARHLALAADHAWVVESCLRLAQLTGRALWRARAEETAGALLDLFWDGPVPSLPGGGGGVFTTGDDAEPLVVRQKELLDGAVPSANSVSADALLWLGTFGADDRALEAGTRIVELVAPLVAEHPLAVADLLAASSRVAGRTEVVVTGDRPDLVAVALGRWLPDAAVSWGDPDGGPLWAGRLPDLAYVCHHFTCAAPTSDAVTLAAQLDQLEGDPEAPGPPRN